MKKKLFGIGFLAVALCLMTACSNGTKEAGSGSQPAASSGAISSAPADQSAAVTSPKTEPDASVSAPSDSPEPKDTPARSAKVNPQSNSQSTGKPLLTGSFESIVDKNEDPITDGDGYIQTMIANSGTIVIGRFATSHATEAYMDQYSPDEFDVTERVTVDGNRGTHYRWKTGSNEDSAVVDAVVTEADGYSLLFLCYVPQDAFEGKTDLGPTQKDVEAWIASLTVTAEPTT